MSAQTEPGHTSADHMKADGTPDMRFKENGGGEHGNQGGRLSGGFEEDGDGTSRLVTEGSGEDATYKPSAHGGKKEDGTDDKRMSSEHGFGGDKEAASEAGKKGGSASYENGGLTQ
ncbi:uncharacterized protein MKK02DRAFT_40734 [Dioszegia hungarica]|uniref:Uncharacterized protein n=1 Tax=Dioszegia hungarica TaxID=4972 RepID=A0AA38LTC0_9TREE|nr:uncharacterized protein MKK02DRAFT_40734 [Dioszegia hungarica]KAI9632431.1 hypothetical protein MKK02DRAFT_40734 [Dioszegia hungarica]